MLLSLFLGIEGANGFGGMGKGGIVLVHQNLSDDGGDRLDDIAAVQFVGQGLPELVANSPLCVGHTAIQRHLMDHVLG